ncbi:MAG: hypothetical protein SV422_04255 [Pseudomonadota bacterium]|nr:hypothetical protein [Pseudomonadota bacterium]
MNKLIACAAACLLLLGAETASADHRDHRWDRGHSHYDHHDRGRGWGNGHRNHRHYRDRDRVSVSVNIGNVIPDWRYRDYRRATSGLGIAYTTAWGAPYNTYGRGNTVIVHQNTYVNNEPRVIYRSTRSTTSLLRDVSGRCFERSYDSRGVETRIELPASNCNF